MADTDKKATDPDAIAEARDRIKIAKEGTASSPTGEKPAPTDAPAGDAEPGPVKVDKPLPDPKDQEVEQLKTQNAELQSKFDRQNGEYGSKLDALTQQLAQLNEQMSLLVEENKTLRAEKGAPADEAAAAAPTPLDASARSQYIEGIPAAVVAEYGDEVVTLVIGIARNVLRIHGQEAVEPLRQSLEHVQETSEEMTFLREVEALAPGFIEHNGIPSRKQPTSPEWAARLKETYNPDAPELGSTKDYIQAHGNAVVVARIFKQFLATLTNAPEKKPPVDIAGQAVPDGSSAAPPDPPPAETPFSQAKYEALREELRQGRPDGMTIEIYNQKRAQLRTMSAAALRERVPA